jgi:hypothetical protein
MRKSHYPKGEREVPRNLPSRTNVVSSHEDNFTREAGCGSRIHRKDDSENRARPDRLGNRKRDWRRKAERTTDSTQPRKKRIFEPQKGRERECDSAKFQDNPKNKLRNNCLF